MSKTLKNIIVNFLTGGVTIALFATIADKFNYGFVGNLIGSLPIITTYMIFHAYIKSNSPDTDTISMLWQGVWGALIYIIFNIIFILIYKSLKNIVGSYFIAFAGWVLLQIILIVCILPQFGIKLLKNRDLNPM